MSLPCDVESGSPPRTVARTPGRALDGKERQCCFDDILIFTGVPTGHLPAHSP